MPQRPGIGTDHHCPGAKISKLKGNCAGKDHYGYCTQHQIVCRQCGWQHLKIEPCVKCSNAADVSDGIVNYAIGLTWRYQMRYKEATAPKVQAAHDRVATLLAAKGKGPRRSKHR